MDTNKDAGKIFLIIIIAVGLGGVLGAVVIGDIRIGLAIGAVLALAVVRMPKETPSGDDD